MIGHILAWTDSARGLLAQREYGLLLDRISNRIMPVGNPVIYWDRFVIVELADPRPVRRCSEAAPLLAGPEDIDALARMFPDRAALFRRRAAAGQRCYVIKDGDRIVARQWIVDDRRVFDSNAGLRFHPPVHPALWCHDIFVDPAYRIRGYFVALMHNAWVIGARDGLPPRLYGEIHWLNQGSLRAHARFGYRIIRRVTIVSCLALKLYVIEDERGQRRFEHRQLWRVEHI